MKLHLLAKFKIGRVVRLFVLGDLALIGGWGLVNPIFALFVIEDIKGATVVTVGIAAAVYWIVKALLQVPIAQFLDKTPSEKDDFIVLISGLILAAFVAFAFTLINNIWQLYLIQIIHAAAFAMYSPSWQGIFSRHLDKKHVALDWALDNATISIAAGITGLVSGFLVTWLGFSSVFILAGILSFVSAAIIFSVPYVIFPHRVRKQASIADHRPITNVHQ